MRPVPMFLRAGPSIQDKTAGLLRCKLCPRHDLAPAGKIRLHPLRQRVAASRFGVGAMALETFDDLWIGQYLVQRPVEEIEDGCRRAGRRK